MASVHRASVIRGGIVAGLILLIMEMLLMAFLEPTWIDIVRQMGGSPPGLGAGIAYAVVLVALGMVLVWLYAAIRPRYGPGPRTAIMAGVATWLIAWVVGFGSAVTLGLFPTGFVVIVLAWGLLESIAAALAGGAMYKETD